MKEVSQQNSVHKPPGITFADLSLESTLPGWARRNPYLFNEAHYQFFVSKLYFRYLGKFREIEFEDRKDIIHDVLMTIYEMTAEGEAYGKFNDIKSAYNYIVTACNNKMIRRVDPKYELKKAIFASTLALEKDKDGLTRFEAAVIHRDAAMLLREKYGKKILAKQESVFLELLCHAMEMDIDFNLSIQKQHDAMQQQICEKMGINMNYYYSLSKRLKNKLADVYNQNTSYKRIFDEMKDKLLSDRELTNN